VYGGEGEKHLLDQLDNLEVDFVVAQKLVRHAVQLDAAAQVEIESKS
jgi:hypothetical protein